MSKTAVSLAIKDHNGSYDYKYCSDEEKGKLGATDPLPALVFNKVTIKGNGGTYQTGGSQSPAVTYGSAPVSVLIPSVSAGAMGIVGILINDADSQLNLTQYSNNGVGSDISALWQTGIRTPVNGVKDTFCRLEFGKNGPAQTLQAGVLTTIPASFFQTSVFMGEITVVTVA